MGRRELRAFVAELAAIPGPSPAKVAAEPAPVRSSVHPVLAHLDELERRLAIERFPPMSPWWRATLERFYRSLCRQLVDRVGRRGGKSSTLCRIAVLEALYGEHPIPRGDVGVVAMVSVSRDEAGQRLRTIRSILDVLGVKYAPRGDSISLIDRPVMFKVYPATLQGVVGFTGICAICDEVAKWRDADTGANPATEVLASLRPTMATQPNARIFLSSSPLGRLDAHAEAFEAGESAFQQVAFAPTWVANPTLTEADTRTLEHDEGKWRREYGAFPMEGNEESLYAAGQLDAVTRAGPLELPPVKGWTYVAAMDPATRGNGWTLIVAARGYDKRHVVLAREWRGTATNPLDADRVLGEIAAIVRPYGVGVVHTDQRSTDELRIIARRHLGPQDRPLVLAEQVMTAGGKIELFENLGTRIGDESVELPPHPVVRADLLGVRRRITASGMTIALSLTPDGRHSDYAQPVAMALERAVERPRAMPQGEAQAVEEDALKRDLERYGPPKKKQKYWTKDPYSRERR